MHSQINKALSTINNHILCNKYRIKESVMWLASLAPWVRRWFKEGDPLGDFTWLATVLWLPLGTLTLSGGQQKVHLFHKNLFQLPIVHKVSLLGTHCLNSRKEIQLSNMRGTQRVKSMAGSSSPFLRPRSPYVNTPWTYGYLPSCRELSLSLSHHSFSTSLRTGGWVVQWRLDR